MLKINHRYEIKSVKELYELSKVLGNYTRQSYNDEHYFTNVSIMIDNCIFAYRKFIGYQGELEYNYMDLEGIEINFEKLADTLDNSYTHFETIEGYSLLLLAKQMLNYILEFQYNY